MNKKFLKPNVVFEPLFESWYAWSHLISPATAAMNIVGRHLKIIESYIKSPQIHAAAVKDPKMLGGPFMDFSRPMVDEVKNLKAETLKHQEKLIILAKAINELTEMLNREASGYSLYELYEKVPEVLKGYVELVYDLNHRPSFRFFESLLYKSEFYNPSYQHIAIWVTENDERPFVLSTPRIESDDILHLNIPFSHPAIDKLASMKRNRGDVEEIKELLNLTDPQDIALFESFFTEEEPRQYSRYTGDKIRMRYFGHACIYVETRNTNILVDPLISYYGYPSDVSRFSDVNLPDEIDYVLITHNHQDHILFESLLPLRHRIKNVIVPRSGTGKLQDPSLKLMLEAIGFDNVIELSEMETLAFDDCEITGIPFLGEHSDLDVQSKLCHHIKIDDFSILFMADSCNIEPKVYEHAHSFIGDIDVLFLGMECAGAPLSWLYGPLLTEPLARDKDNSRRLSGSDFQKGINLVDIFNPKEVYVYAMGLEPWLEFISSIKFDKASHPIVESDKLIEECRSRGIISERLYGEKELLYQSKKNLVH